MTGNDFYNNVQQKLFTVSDLVCEGNLNATTWLYNFPYTLQQSFTPETIFATAAVLVKVCEGLSFFDGINIYDTARPLEYDSNKIICSNNPSNPAWPA